MAIGEKLSVPATGDIDGMPGSASQIFPSEPLPRWASQWHHRQGRRTATSAHIASA